MTLKTGRDGDVATLTLDHPPLNILTQALSRELRSALAGLAADPSLRALVLAAEGKHFSAGADVSEHLPPAYREMIPEFVATLETLASFPLPVIAAVRGRCLGGGFELAQCADVIVAGEGATFGQPEIVLGVTAPIACVLLPRRASPGLASELLFGGETISALRAQAAGLVQRVVHDDQVESEAQALAQRFARHSAAALRLTKKTLLAAADRPRRDALREAASIYLHELMATEDAVEGLTAFVEKRTPAWRNR
ncbi:MAG TPA: enoyl-CoA hydratase/isomerase family protein [Candidatus Eisenbacteria bacterium]|nr:enoyl-CoA hydratase/isomerase family protein [Candidatus Eisenbacteria bacterium]